MPKTFERISGPNRYRERRDPKDRPANAIPVESILLGYPILDLPPLPADGAGTDGQADDPSADGLAAAHRGQLQARRNVRPPRHNG